MRHRFGRCVLDTRARLVWRGGPAVPALAAVAMLAACDRALPAEPTSAQAIVATTITGRVTGSSRQALEAVSVVAVGSHDGIGYGAATTDEQGLYTLSFRAPSGEWLNIHFSRSGYFATSVPVRVGATAGAVDATLSPDVAKAGLEGLAGPWQGDHVVLALEGGGAACVGAGWELGAVRPVSADLGADELVVRDPTNGAFCRLVLRLDGDRIVGQSFDLLESSSCHYRVATPGSPCGSLEAWAESASLEARVVDQARIDGVLSVEFAVPSGAAWVPLTMKARVRLARAGE